MTMTMNATLLTLVLFAQAPQTQPQETPSQKFFHNELDKIFQQGKNGPPPGMRPIDVPPVPDGVYTFPHHPDRPGLCEHDRAPFLAGELLVIYPHTKKISPVHAWTEEEFAGIKPTDAIVPNWQIVTMAGGRHEGFSTQTIHVGPNVYTSTRPVGRKDYITITTKDSRTLTFESHFLTRLDQPERCQEIYRDLRRTLNDIPRNTQKQRADYPYVVLKIKRDKIEQYHMHVMQYEGIMKIGMANGWDEKKEDAAIPKQKEEAPTPKKKSRLGR